MKKGLQRSGFGDQESRRVETQPELGRGCVSMVFDQAKLDPVIPVPECDQHVDVVKARPELDGYALLVKQRLRTLE